MFNFWDLLLKGIELLIDGFVNTLPMHREIGLATTVLGIAQTTIGVSFTIIFSNINMLLPIITFGIFFILEVVRLGFSIYRLITKKVVPFVGA